MASTRSFLFLYFIEVVTLMFCKVSATPQLSGNLLEGANIFKCKCNINQAINAEGKCVPASNSILILDEIRRRYFITDISNFTSVTVNPISCQPGHSKITLPVNQFVIYQNGFLGNLYLIDGPPTEEYCVDHILDSSGVSMIAELCYPNPTIPICCPLGSFSNFEGKCQQHSAEVSLNLTLMGGFTWDKYNLTEQSIQCSKGKVIQRTRIGLPNEKGASLVSYPLGNKLQWNSIYNPGPRFFSHNEYCIVSALHDGEWENYAQFCILDQIQQHKITCGNSCLRKCCPQGFILDTSQSVCIPNYQQHRISYTFIQPDGEPMEEDPQNMTLVFGFPFCEQLHFLYSEADEIESLKFDVVGSLITISSGNYSSLDYCAETFVSNFGDSNSSVHTNAIICLKKFEDPCHWRWIVGSVMLGISCVFYLITLSVYLTIRELRNRMVGKCLICQVSALFIAYFTLIFLQNVNDYNGWTCNFPGTVEHISILAAFFWLNVLCYDMWCHIRKMKVVRGQGQGVSRKFFLYCIYAWGTPLLIGSLRVILDLLPSRYSSEWLIKSNLGKTHCFFSGHFSDSIAKWVYLYLPILVLLLANLGFFVHVAIVIRRTEKESEQIMSSSESATTGKNISAKKEKARLYLKLFLVMGITWLLEIIMWVAVPENDCYFWGLDIVNMFQGVFIFAIFVCKKKTLKLVKERFGLASRSSPPTKEQIRLTEGKNMTNNETKAAMSNSTNDC